MNKTVVMDMDGVLADFEGEFCKEFGDDHRELVSLEARYPNQAIRVHEFINDGFVYKRLQPIQLGLDIAKYLYENGFFISIVTSRPFGFDSVNRDWLKRHGVRFHSYKSDRPKAGRIAMMNPLCAVDDLYSVHTGLLGHNIPTILVAQPWNQYSGEELRRVSTLSEFISEFDCIIQENIEKL